MPHASLSHQAISTMAASPLQIELLVDGRLVSSVILWLLSSLGNPNVIISSLRTLIANCLIIWRPMSYGSQVPSEDNHKIWQRAFRIADKCKTSIITVHTLLRPRARGIHMSSFQPNTRTHTHTHHYSATGYLVAWKQIAIQ